MRQLRLASSRTSPPPLGSRNRASHPSLEAFESEFDYIVRTLRRLGVARDDVEDLAHEVFLVLYRTWDKYDSTRPFRPYVFGIAFRVAANHVRKRSREVTQSVVEVEDLQPGPERLLETAKARALILNALERVPLRRRAVLVMHDIDQLKMGEIAESLSIYRFTGYSRLRKARKEFASAITSLLRGAYRP